MLVLELPSICYIVINKAPAPDSGESPSLEG